MSKIVQPRIIQVYNSYRIFGGTTKQWQEHDDPLYFRELGLEYTDDGRVLMKVGLETNGDVGTPWSQLPYVTGPAGSAPDIEWDGTNIRFKNPDGTWGDWADVQGGKGLPGEKGKPGDPRTDYPPATKTALGVVSIGKHVNVDESGRVSVPEATEEVFGVARLLTEEEVAQGLMLGPGPAFVSVADVVNLRGRGPQGEQGDPGDDGDRGPSGPAPAYQWSGASLRFKNPDGTWGVYVNLTGPQGPAGENCRNCHCDCGHCTSDNC